MYPLLNLQLVTCLLQVLGLQAWASIPGSIYTNYCTLMWLTEWKNFKSLLVSWWRSQKVSINENLKSTWEVKREHRLESVCLSVHHLTMYLLYIFLLFITIYHLTIICYFSIYLSTYLFYVSNLWCSFRSEWWWINLAQTISFTLKRFLQISGEKRQLEKQIEGVGKKLSLIGYGSLINMISCKFT